MGQMNKCHCLSLCLMASWREHAFCITGLCAVNPPIESPTKSSNADLWRLIWCSLEYAIEQVELHVMWDALTLTRCHCNGSQQGAVHTVYPESKVHGVNIGPTWVLSASDGPHIGPMNLAIRVDFEIQNNKVYICWMLVRSYLISWIFISIYPKFQCNSKLNFQFHLWFWIHKVTRHTQPEIYLITFPYDW